MLMPKKVKFRNGHRGNNKGIAVRGSDISFGTYGLKAVERGLISSRQLEAARKAVTHNTKRGGRLWIRIFPDKPIAKKPNETRMGSGKSPTDHYAAVIRPGKVIFELAGVNEKTARDALRSAAYKLPIKTKFVKVEE